jgi:hypothetical protein
MGDLAAGGLKRAKAELPTLETSRRIEVLLGKLDGTIKQPEMLQSLRAVAVLEDIATTEARQILESLAQGEPNARLTQEAKAGLERVARLRNNNP